MIKKIDHIGVAVHSIEAVLPFYTDVLQLTLLGYEEIPSQQVKVTFLSAGETKIELLEPMSEDSAIAKFLSKRGEGIHHIAYGVTDITTRIAELKEKGVPLIDEIPRAGAANAKIAFLHPKAANNVLVELCEKRGDHDDD
ncbi:MULTISPECIES: methylmalonyl-CoA epimerase [Metabacillus]|jgi:methylmalonyl-CoA/ethylmalonyl-CoA epimerase|uniref:Methylmalonyl-CoA epimerase n=2 Tax=Metabacillus TaxID=2675233 RepID=A0A179T286_9BACI|nr:MULTISPECIES: methylmalonyl-CoA epimerase [Metabacillus]OAS87500.1 methylmalonyl-CoA epimerase [Metabacillus litoralis]QNF26087.1 methylmalonyl-CoA epimerase [Metabacillus sp. KUDC1714]